MAALGFDYTFKCYWERSPEDVQPKAPVSATSAAGKALYGNLLDFAQTGAPRSQQVVAAGILARAIRETGMTFAH